MIISKDVRYDELKLGYPLLHPYPIEKNSKIVVQFEITSLDKNIHVQPYNICKASSNSLVKETSLVRKTIVVLGPKNLKDKILFLRTRRLHTNFSIF